MSVTNRRDFLARTSMALAAPLLLHRSGATSQGLLSQPLAVGTRDAQFSADRWLPEATPGETLRALATHAIDAAKSVGATYADVRVAELHLLQPSLITTNPRYFGAQLEAKFAYGVRVVVNGATAFVYGATPSADGIAAAARTAVQTARGYTRANRPTTPGDALRDGLAAAPVVTGEWTTPHEIDPFTIPLEDHAAALGAFRAASLRVLYAQDPTWSGVGFRWTRERRVFASTEGSLITQTRFLSAPIIVAAGNLGRGDWKTAPTKLHVPGFSPMSGGFETVTSLAHQDTIKRLTEEAVELASLPRGMVDVGRYPVAFDGMAFGAILAQTLGPALECDRVMGWERDASGGSFVTLQTLGTQIASPLLSVTPNRTVPSVSAVQWDDDGVVPDAYPCIRDGRLLDLHTSRATAPMLADWYQSQRMPVRSHGHGARAAPDGDARVDPGQSARRLPESGARTPHPRRATRLHRSPIRLRQRVHGSTLLLRKRNVRGRRRGPRPQHSRERAGVCYAKVLASADGAGRCDDAPHQ
jgi:predicted Zn-dependent protease